MSKKQYNINEYNKKRNFNATNEPKATEKKSGSQNRFSFQKHGASSLHYDFRLEYDGVLKSWAIPKGPSIDKRTKRLAIRTEDHPLDYIDFEGVIPEGNYGAGKVLLWDKGTYENITQEDGNIQDLGKAIDNGHFLVKLAGEKISGGYAMTRINDDKGQWLLVKMDDDEADGRRNPTSTEPKSVKSGKTLEEIQ